MMSPQPSGVWAAGAKMQTGELISHCVWSAGVDTLLPETDRVGFVRGQEVVAFGRWEKVREVVGHLMEPADMYPPRWHVTEFSEPGAD